MTEPSRPRPDTARPGSSTISDARHASKVHSPGSAAVCNDTVTHPEEAGGSGGRPWPAPSPDADWWRADTADASDASERDPAVAEAEVVDREDDDGFDDPDFDDPDLDDPDLDEADHHDPDPYDRDLDEPGLPESAVGAPASSARPYDQPPRPPARPATATSLPARREPERVAWVTEPVPVVPPSVPVEPPPVPVDSPPAPVEPAPAVGAAPPAPAVRTVPAQRRSAASPVRRPPRRRRRRLPRRPWFALPGLVVLALASTFFAWVSAEPFWLAVGHGYSGTATVVAGAGGQAGTADGCRAFFIADDGTFIASDVDLRGLGPVECTDGAKVTAHMVSVRAEQAYAMTAFGLHLRWLTGLGLVLLCALVIVWLTGAARFAGWRRGVAVGLSLGGPAAVTIAMLTAAF